MGQKGRGWDREIPEGFDEFREDGKPRCWGRSNKRGGAQCPNPSMKGQKVCRYHGGMAPQNLAKAQERIVEERARVLVETYGRKIETTATEALLEEVQWTAGHVAWLRERVQEIEAASADVDPDWDEDEDESGVPRTRPSSLVWGITRRKTGGDDHGVTEEASPNIWLKLYHQERTHLVKVCAEAIKAGIEERRVKLAEEQGALVAQAIRRILGDLGLTPEQEALVPEVVPRHLRAL